MDPATLLLLEVGSRLRARRLALGLTQAEVVARAGVSPRFLVDLEKGEGNISLRRLREVCAALGLPLEQLFRGLGPGGAEKLGLVGLRGAGKSTIGRLLAERLSCRFIELDRQVEASAGLSLGAIFELRGESGYRALEQEALHQALALPGRAVIACGGSLPTRPETWRRLRGEARTIWLQASPAAHLQRVMDQGDLRPMRGHPEALRELELLLAERSQVYREADLHLDTELLGIEATLARIQAWL
jgi:XRE family aerobic/anaerobic benzoate catabolism transcriptional regulator